MITKQAKVADIYGMTCRLASLIVKASKNCNVKIAHNGNDYSSKSMLGIIALEIEKDSIVEVISEGQEEEKACEDVVKILETQLNYH
jgi:phosphotransferase system HPr (HPr) family protein